MGTDPHPGPSPGPWGSTGLDHGTMSRLDTPTPGPIGLDAKGASKGGAEQSLADRVVSFARQRRGQVHGNGECFTLADDALRHAGAKSAADFGRVAPDADYVWGAAVARTHLQAGDIIQMRDYHLELESSTEHPDGSSESESRVESRPHHTAIVESIGTDGRVTVLEQNVPDGGPVTRSVLHLTSTTYASGAATVHAVVTGTFWFYRPQAR